MSEMQTQSELTTTPQAATASKNAKTTTATAAPSRTRAIALVGLSIALFAVCSWVTIPIGPIPFTLQMFAIPFALCVLRPSEAVAAIVGYLVLGTIGVPVFSGMRGGLGVIMGPTGGFLLGYMPGVVLAALLLFVTQPLAKRLAKDPAPTEDGLPPTITQHIRANLFGFCTQVAANVLSDGWAQAGVARRRV